MLLERDMKTIQKGRPNKITPDIEKKLESILKIGGTIAEAVTYAGIAERTYYSMAKRNEDFKQKMERAKHYADVVAKNVVVDAIVKDNTAKWWLEKRVFRQGPQVVQQFNVGGDTAEIVWGKEDAL